MIIVVGHKKGGVGKSTLTTNICVELARRGGDVVLVDADRQATCATWVNDRDEFGVTPSINCIQKYENIRSSLLDLNSRYEFVIVDAAGRDSKELRTGITAADILLIPCKASQPDIDQLEKMGPIIEHGMEINPNLKVLGVFSMTHPNPKVKEKEDSSKISETFEFVEELDVQIKDRKIYRDAISEGKSVMEMNNEKAKSEIVSLVDEVLQHG